MSVPIFLMKFAAKKVLGDLFTGSSRDRNEVNYDKTRDLDKFSEEKVELEELPENSFNKDDYQSRVDSLFVRGESVNLVDALKETSKLNVDLMSDVTNSVDEKMKVMSENIEKVKDVAETSSNLANLNLQTSLNNTSASGGIIAKVTEGVRGLINGLVSGVLLGVQTLSDKVGEGFRRIEDKLVYGRTHDDDNPAPGASEETIEDRNSAVEAIANDVEAESAALEEFITENMEDSYLEGPKEGEERAWLEQYDKEHGIERPTELSDAQVRAEIASLKEQNLMNFDWDAQSRGMAEISTPYEEKKVRDEQYYDLTNTLADNESKLKFNSLIGETHNYMSKYGYSEESLKALSSNLKRGRFPLFTKGEYKKSLRDFASKIKERVVNDEDLMKAFSSKEIGLTKEDDPLKFLGNALYYSSGSDYSDTLVSSVDSKGNHNLSLYEQVASQKEVSRGNAVIFDNKGNVVTNYDFLTDGVLSSKDASKYEVLTDSPEPTFNILGTKDVTFNANRENFQAVLEQVIQRNEAFSDQKIDVMKIMDYIDNNDGKLDDYLTLMTQAVSLGFSDVVSLVSNIVNDSSNNGVVLVSTDTD